jgi:hypothetical protein
LGCRPAAKRCTQQTVIKHLLLLLLLLLLVDKRGTSSSDARHSWALRHNGCSSMHC